MCRKYYETVPTTKWVKECNPVFDEKCKTSYLQHCKSDTRCVMIYQTVCSSMGYDQHCTNEVRFRALFYCHSGGKRSRKRRFHLEEFFLLDFKPARAQRMKWSGKSSLSLAAKEHLLPWPR